MIAINEGLELAERVEGYGEAAKGRRLSIPGVYLQQKPSEWTLGDCTVLVDGFLDDLDSIAKAAGRQVAIFVDEYDRPCINVHPLRVCDGLIASGAERILLGCQRDE